MNLQGVLFGSPPTIAKGTEEIILGPVMSEGSTHTASVTNHAVEKGLNIGDHVRSNPDSFSVKTILVDKNITGGLSDAVSAIVDPLTVKKKIKKLKQWRNDGALLKYSGPVFSGLVMNGYDIAAQNLVLTSITISRTQETGAGIDLSLSLQQVTIAQSMTQEIKLPQGAKNTTNKGQTEKGTTNVTPKGSSILSKWTG